MKHFVLILLTMITIDARAQKNDNYKIERDYIQTILPLVDVVNQEVLKERAEVEKINTDDISDAQKKLLEGKAKKYDIFTRLKGDVRYRYLKSKLLGKIDILSPSLLIAISGIETNWGQSRIVKEGNSLYKELSWDNTGIQPDVENVQYRIKKFETPLESMRSFLLKINSSVDFEHLRHDRSLYRAKKEPMQGRSVAHNFNLISPLKNYTGLLDYTITFYELDELDRQNNYFIPRRVQ